MLINPMWFYWMNVFGKMQILCFIVCVFTGFIGCLAFGCYIEDCGEDSLKAAKRLMLVTLCFGLIGIFAPSEKNYDEDAYSKSIKRNHR